MLPKLNRLNRNDFKAFFDNKKSVKAKNLEFGTIFVNKEFTGFKVGLIMGKKTLKSKVGRNLARRWIYRAMREANWLDLKTWVVIKLSTPPTDYKQAQYYVEEIKKTLF